MTQAAEVTSGPDTSWKSLYKAGGISFILAGVLVLASLLTFIIVPSIVGASGEEGLKLIAANRSLYILRNAIFGLSLIFLVPGVLALYVAVKDRDKSYALLGAGILLFALTDLVLSEGSTGALVALSDKYAATTTDAQRAIFSTAAEAINTERTAFRAGPVMGGIGLIIISIVMMKGVFHKGIGYLGIATGLVLLLASLLGFFFIIFTVLLAVWSIAVGSKLYKLG